MRLPDAGLGIGPGPSGELSIGELSLRQGTLSAQGVSAGSCPFPGCGTPALVPDGVWDFTERLVSALATLNPRHAASVAERIAEATTDEELNEATADTPSIRELVEEAVRKADTPFWKQLVATAAITFLGVLPGVMVDYQAKVQAHHDATRQIDLAERQLELAENELGRQEPTVLDQEAVDALVARILTLVGQPADSIPSAPPITPAVSQPAPPGRNEPCWCGSRKKYKFCHLKDDKFSGDVSGGRQP